MCQNAESHFFSGWSTGRWAPIVGTSLVCLVWYEAVCFGCLPSTLLTRTCVDWRQHRALQSPRSRRAAKVTKGVFVKRKRTRKSSQVEGQTGVFHTRRCRQATKVSKACWGCCVSDKGLILSDTSQSKIGRHYTIQIPTYWFCSKWWFSIIISLLCCSPSPAINSHW